MVEYWPSLIEKSLFLPSEVTLFCSVVKEARLTSNTETFKQQWLKWLILSPTVFKSSSRTGTDLSLVRLCCDMNSLNGRCQVYLFTRAGLRLRGYWAMPSNRQSSRSWLSAVRLF